MSISGIETMPANFVAHLQPRAALLWRMSAFSQSAPAAAKKRSFNPRYWIVGNASFSKLDTSRPARRYRYTAGKMLKKAEKTGRTSPWRVLVRNAANDAKT